jgi:plasmid stabilization system protein ParE
MRIVILPSARDDLARGVGFYETQGEGLGEYFRESLISDVDSLKIYAGIHQRVFGFHRLLSKRFPYAIYYLNDEAAVFVRAILDCRRDPKALSRKLSK